MGRERKVETVLYLDVSDQRDLKSVADKKKEKLFFSLRLAASVAILVYLFLKIDLRNFPGIRDFKGIYIAGAILSIFLDRLLNAYRWSLLIHSKGLGVNFLEVVKIYFKSNFLGLILPSSVGGEVLKGYGLYKSTSRGIDSVSSIIVERILGLIALTSICGGSYYLFRLRLMKIKAVIAVGNLSILILLFIIALLSLGYFLLPNLKNASLRDRGRIFPLIVKIWIAFYEYWKEKKTLISAFVLSLSIQVIRIILTWLAGLSVGITLELSYYVLFVPFIALISMIPFSIGGLGIQEGSFVYFFSLTGVSSAKVLGMAILVRMLIIISVSPGGLIYLKEGLGSGERKFAGKKNSEVSR